MSVSVVSPFATARTFVFRPGLVLHRLLATPAPNPAAQAARQARKRQKKEAKNERLRNFFGWCEGCAAYGSIF